MKPISAILILLALACNTSDKTIQKLSWLNGTWQIIDTSYSNHGVQVFEKWTASGDTAYHGLTYSVHQGDTEILEALQIGHRGKDLYYIATVNNQNGGESVPFKSEYTTTDSLCFGNPEHDFPKFIQYFREKDGTITAVVSMEKHAYSQLQTDVFKNNRDAVMFKLKKVSQ
jgi:hypothetical protein